MKKPRKPAPNIPTIRQLDPAALTAVIGGTLSGPEEDYNYRMGIITDSSVFQTDEWSQTEC